MLRSKLQEQARNEPDLEDGSPNSRTSTLPTYLNCSLSSTLSAIIIASSFLAILVLLTSLTSLGSPLSLLGSLSSPVFPSSTTCLTTPRCTGSFDYVLPSPSARVSDVDMFGLPYSADPTEGKDVEVCKDMWERVEERNAGNKQLPKSTWREDLTVYENYFGGKLKGGGGFYLELGGFDGIAESNSRFYERCLGWSGLLIEASPTMFPKLMENRPLAHRMNLAPTCKDDADETVTFLPSKFTNAKIYDPTNPSHVKYQHNIVEVHCGPLKAYLAALDIKHIDFFSLDVEGAELLVLKQFDFDAVTVDVFMVESDNVYHKAGDVDSLEIRKIMREAGFVLKTGLVRKSDVYVREGFVIQVHEKQSPIEGGVGSQLERL